MNSPVAAVIICKSEKAKNKAEKQMREYADILVQTYPENFDLMYIRVSLLVSRVNYHAKEIEKQALHLTRMLEHTSCDVAVVKAFYAKYSFNFFREFVQECEKIQVQLDLLPAPVTVYMWNDLVNFYNSVQAYLYTAYPLIWESDDVVKPNRFPEGAEPRFFYSRGAAKIFRPSYEHLVSAMLGNEIILEGEHKESFKIVPNKEKLKEFIPEINQYQFLLVSECLHKSN